MTLLTAPHRRSRRGFTLVELVVVVLILGILAAVAAPKMFDTASAARENGTKQSLSVLRDAIELYKAKNGNYPAASSLTTDLQSFLKGPFPAPQIGGNQNATVAASTQSPIASAESGTAGWAYNQTTGQIVVNDASYISW
ncbi:MAG TPA: prepilin-type N-terminal cleavage/methylation domain-containing protein [Planctomycetaceae bacterium]|nr:prepilin-type N-terminal cleavage/methylation domain-containing protein [Planctomycetaceae bacterium]